ncbi:kallistatin, partial [Carlito syrichta]|uniref:Kallistatin n=1 Tax=Carlito syrichta TaxID=1868482 RepID=A0A1U7TTR5_CARSF
PEPAPGSPPLSCPRVHPAGATAPLKRTLSRCRAGESRTRVPVPYERPSMQRMGPTARLLPLLAGLLALSHGQPGDEGPANRSHPQAAGSGDGSPSLRIAPANTDFALRLYHLVVSEAPGANIFFSPLSISVAYAMLSLGANPQSRGQIFKGLGFNLTELAEADIHGGFQHLLRTLALPSHGLETHVGSALFLSRDLEFLPTFLNATAAFYEPRLLHTNFRNPARATQLINDHVQKDTRGKIASLVSELPADTLMVLVNYIYFKALWEKPFASTLTTPHHFHVDENTTVQVPMMQQDGQHHWFLHDRYLPCSVLRMDYQGDARALFVLPDQGKTRQVEEVLTPEMITRWNNLLQHRYLYKKLELYFPKFSISSSYMLHQMLPRLGFTHLFSRQAGLSGITKELSLQVSRSFHKATLDVDEAGTEAAAATSSSSRFLSAWRNRNVLWFNRPFFVVIFSPSTQSILFLGKVVNPTKS